MAMISPTHAPLVFMFGVLGNLASFVVFLAPVPTFVRICKKKSTEGFQSIPYLTALSSAMLWLYYALLKNDPILLISNSLGCLIETIYILILIFYAPKIAKVFTMRILVLVNFVGYFSILISSHFLAKGSSRVEILGWTCTSFSVCVFAAPLSIMRVVIKTKSVEFMPFHLSFFLSLSAITWLFYGLLLKDLYVTVPNIIGIILGVLQMILYLIYKKCKTVSVDPNPDVEIAAEMQKSATASPHTCNDCGRCQAIKIGILRDDQEAAYNCVQCDKIPCGV